MTSVVEKIGSKAACLNTKHEMRAPKNSVVVKRLKTTKNPLNHLTGAEVI